MGFSRGRFQAKLIIKGSNPLPGVHFHGPFKTKVSGKKESSKRGDFFS